MKEYLSLCLKGKISISERQKVLENKLQESEQKKKKYKKKLIMLIGNKISIKMFYREKQNILVF